MAAVGLERQRQLGVMLSMVTVPGGAWVLELDTDLDFGYSALLLARAARGGRVVSVHESDELSLRAYRAQKSWSPEQAARLLFRTGPLAAGWAAEAPYDLIVSHCRFGWLPGAWLAQCKPGASIVMPLDHGGAAPRVFIRVTVDDQQRPVEPTVLLEVDVHPHRSRYEATSEVTMRPENGGYSIDAGF